LWDTVRIALSSLRANKLRTGLTGLGVVIGIGTIIGMLSVINGINRTVTEELETLGPNVVYVTRYEPGVRVGRVRRQRPNITVDDISELARRCDSIHRISLVAEWRGKVAYRGTGSGMLNIVGVQADYADVGKVDISEGRFFTQLEGGKSKVCVLGSGVRDALFGRTAALGKEVLIGGRRFEVLGLLSREGRIFGSSSDETVIVPYRWFRAMYGETGGEYAMALPADGVEVDDAIDHLRVTLRQIRKLAPGTDDEFALSTQESFLARYRQLTRSIYWVMRIVASIALLVSGIGIMNIMLVVVMERTAEIGLRKAVGASRLAITGQFVVEAIMMTIVGGLVGIGLGFLMGVFVSAFTPLRAVVPLWAVPFALGVCCAVGILFGLVPAMRASGLDPVKALRYE
jgi:putative ABC transport system permease protein